MNRLLLAGLVILLIGSNGCSNKDKAPGDIIPKEKMEDLLWDIIQAERFTATFIKDSSKDIKTENFKLYAQIFSLHQVTKDEFVKSYRFYLSRPDISRVLFDSLSARGNRAREDMYKTPIQSNQPDSAAKPTDSLNRADSLKRADTAKIKPSLQQQDSQPASAIRKKSPLLKPLPQVAKPDTGKSSVKPTSPLMRVKRDTSKAAMRNKFLLRSNRRLRDSLLKRGQ